MPSTVRDRRNTSPRLLVCDRSLSRTFSIPSCLFSLPPLMLSVWALVAFRKLLIKKPTDKTVVPKTFSAVASHSDRRDIVCERGCTKFAPRHDSYSSAYPATANPRFSRIRICCCAKEYIYYARPCIDIVVRRARFRRDLNLSQLFADKYDVSTSPSRCH